MGSHSALTSALLNIVDNAVRYTAPDTQVVLSVRDAAGGICIHVDDCGPGVSPAEQERIFEPFARGSAGDRADALTALERRNAGVGLGLAISRKILELHAAQIAVAHSPLGGARFSIEFRAAAVEHAPVALPHGSHIELGCDTGEPIIATRRQG